MSAGVGNLLKQPCKKLAERKKERQRDGGREERKKEGGSTQAMLCLVFSFKKKTWGTHGMFHLFKIYTSY